MADPLPVGLAELRAAVPGRCFGPRTARSFLHLTVDLAALAALQIALAKAESPWLVAPLVFAAGTVFWALFVLGHDCGHGSFSRHAVLNTAVGHLVHTPLLVPYHAWRLSHRRHHRFAGDVDRDEGWFPLTETQWRTQPGAVRALRSWLLPLVFPAYLLRGTPERAGNHYDADSALFEHAERGLVRTSIQLCLAAAALLVAATAILGPGAVARHWLLPWIVFCGWISVVTYLHHIDARLPWYRGESWQWLRGALSTADRRYGIFEKIHHDAGCHVVHHLFPSIPHYHLREAAAAVKPLLGALYLEDRTLVLRALLRSLRACQVVPSEGGILRYARRSSPKAPAPSGAGSSPITT